MKTCPRCESGYPDELTTCPVHGDLLNEIRDLKPGMLIRGTYRIQRKLSRGGMGDVYLARHILLDEQLVLKFLSSSLSSDPEWTDRFLREVRTLRHIRHKNVIAAGNLEPAEDGRLFFTMEFVDGPDLMEFYRHAPKPFDVPLALTIVRGIAEGLGAAHAAGVVHRDIKAENILIAHERDELVPKIADFGIVAGSDMTRLTMNGSAMLTPQFAAPEQWLGAGDFDGRTDFYALGGLLFELLTGQCAIEKAEGQDWASLHLNAPPRPPSSLRPELAHWQGLDDFVLQLLAKDANDRPRDVRELLRLLKQIGYAAPEAPPTAADSTPATREIPPAQPAPQEAAQAVAGPAPEASAAAIAAPIPEIPEAAAVAPIPEPLPAAAVAELPPEPRPFENLTPATGPGERLDAVIAGSEAADEVHFAPAREPAETLDPELAPAQAAAETRAGIMDEAPEAPPAPAEAREGPSQAKATTHAGEPEPRSARAPARFSELEPKAEPEDPIEEIRAELRRARDERMPIWQPFQPRSAERPKAKLAHTEVAFASETAASKKTDAPAEKPENRPYGLHLLAVVVAIVAVVLAIEIARNPLHSRVLAGQHGPIVALAFSPDGLNVASASRDGTVQVWNVSDGRPLGALAANTNALAYAPMGRTLATGMLDNTIDLWDPARGVVLATLQGHTAPVEALAFSPDGHTLASGSSDRTVRVWDVSSGILLRTLTGSAGSVLSVAYSPDSRILASAGAGRAIRFWDPATGAPLRVLSGDRGPIRSIAFSPNGQLLVSASDDRTIRLWNVAAGTLNRTFPEQAGPALSVAFSPDGRMIASGDADTTVKLWDTASGRLLRTIRGHKGAVTAVAFSPYGSILATAGADRTVRLWKIAKLRE